jgi:FkbM family methyltransferase
MRGQNVVWKIQLDWLAEKMGLLPAMTVCECSVGPLEISTSPGFVGKCDRLLLIEPEPHMAAEAERVLKTKVLQVAVDFQPGQKMMVYNNGSSYLDGTWAPTQTGQRRFIVEAVTFDTLDDGQIDILNLDCEGAEWAVLSFMKSEPKLLAIENCDDNPYYKDICQWLKDHDYIMRFFTGPWGETQIYTKKGL